MPDDFSQANRRLRIETPLGPDALLITALSGAEGISTLFHFQAELLGRDEKADFDAIVGKGVTISVAAGGGDRFFHGVVSRFAQSGTVGRHATYQADIVPWLWFLTRTSDCRIFQKKSVPDIVKQLFGEYGFTDFRFKLSGSYEPREYCVQYRETDFNFVARLFEEEGIFFFFAHEDGKHTAVLADTPRAHEPCPVLDHVRFVHAQESLDEDDVVTWFSKEQELRPSKYSLTDYNFEIPSLDLMAEATGSDSRTFELYDYPAGGMKRDRTEALARVRQQEEDATRVLFRGAGYARSLTPGYKCSLRATGDGVPTTFDGDYIVTAVRHRASESYAGGEESAVSYENDFECVDVAIPFRPARRTSRPVVNGVQPAVVVGPAGEEIFVDRYGRVKVQFFWDREGKRDENSSCWLRVSQPWAGKGWGGVSIPRIGQEVIVSFLEGDPDQPIIVGRVYNGEQMPPYALPGGGVVSGLKSQTHKGSGYNELSMDDTAGKEKITIHGQYDLNTWIEHDEAHHIKNNRTITVDGTHTETIKKDTKITITDGSYSFDVATGTATIHVKGDVKETFDATQSTEVANDITIQSKSTKIHITAATEIQLQVGASTLLMKASGEIKLTGTNVAIDGSQQLNLHGGQLMSKADSNHSTEGAIVISNGSASNTVKGGMVMLNP